MGYRNVIDRAADTQPEPALLAIETSGHSAWKDNRFVDDGTSTLFGNPPPKVILDTLVTRGVLFRCGCACGRSPHQKLQRGIVFLPTFRLVRYRISDIRHAQHAHMT